MKKYLDILVFSLLFFFLFSFFQGRNQEVALDGIQFETSQKTYSVPASVSLQVINNTPQSLNFESCNTLSLRRNGVLIDIPQDLCREVSL